VCTLYSCVGQQLKGKNIYTNYAWLMRGCLLYWSQFIINDKTNFWIFLGSKFDLNSEPETRCYKKQKASSGENWKTMIVSILYSVMFSYYQLYFIKYSSIYIWFQHWQSFIVELISIAVAAFSTGSDYKCLQVCSFQLKKIKSMKIRNFLCHLNRKCLKYCSSEMW